MKNADLHNRHLNMGYLFVHIFDVKKQNEYVM